MSILLKLIENSRKIAPISTIGFKTAILHLNLNKIKTVDENEIALDKSQNTKSHQKKQPLIAILPPNDFYYAKKITEFAKAGQVLLILIYILFYFKFIFYLR